MSLFLPIFAETVAQAENAAKAEGMTAKPVDLINLGHGFWITNSMVAEVLAVLVVVTIINVGMANPKLVPSGLQNFVEWIVELMQNFLEGLAGRKTTLMGFWYFAGVFIFVLFENLIALLPGFGTFGWGHYVDGKTGIWNFEVTEPFLRGANANVNVTAAYAAIFFVMFFYWCYRGAGVMGTLGHVFGSKVKFPNPIANFAFIVIFFLVGWIEVLSILFIRPVAFTFRLFGNIFGGEYLLDTMYKLAPNFAWAILIPCYMYELLVAFVQAFVLFALTAAFTGIITNTGHDSEEGNAHH